MHLCTHQRPVIAGASVNHLNQNINNLPFSKEDDMKLWDGHKQLGKKWVEVSTKFFNESRSENQVKNR